MSAVSAPFGFRPAYHNTGLERARPYPITGGYATAMFKGQPVTLAANGTIQAAAGAADIKGILAGVEFVDASGKPNQQPNWPAGQAVAANTQAIAWVYEDPQIVYEVQANGPVPLTAIGGQADAVNIGAGSAATGLSTSGLNATLVADGAQGQFRIIELARYENNAWGDAFTIVRVQIARDQYIANKVSV